MCMCSSDCFNKYKKWVGDTVKPLKHSGHSWKAQIRHRSEFWYFLENTLQPSTAWSLQPTDVSTSYLVTFSVATLISRCLWGLSFFVWSSVRGVQLNQIEIRCLTRSIPPVYPEKLCGCFGRMFQIVAMLNNEVSSREFCCFDGKWCSNPIPVRFSPPVILNCCLSFRLYLGMIWSKAHLPVDAVSSTCDGKTHQALCPRCSRYLSK